MFSDKRVIMAGYVSSAVRFVDCGSFLKFSIRQTETDSTDSMAFFIFNFTLFPTE
jgi:hypothetical protein